VPPVYYAGRRSRSATLISSFGCNENMYGPMKSEKIGNRGIHLYEIVMKGTMKRGDLFPCRMKMKLFVSRYCTLSSDSDTRRKEVN
jgi:hypothetical protein